MKPKIIEFESSELLTALAHYKVWATKLAEIKLQQPTLWYEIHLSTSTINNGHLITINTGKI